MESKQVNDIVTVCLEGEINSYNAEGVEKGIEEILSKKIFNKLILDLEKVNYVSSAGLRIFLKMKQKYKDVEIIEACLEVYDVLSMTGFVNIMDIKKALKRISVDGAEVIGEGFFSTVYRVDKDMIVKVFNRTSDAHQIERELNLAKQAFVLGIPTAISFDIVKVGDKLGVRFEMLDCISLQKAFINQPEQYDSLLERYVQLLKKINSTECFDPAIPHVKEQYLKKVDFIKNELGDNYYQKAKKIIEDLPEVFTFVHGDCHFKNIMVQGDELLLIDMDTLSVGNPIFELAGLRAPYVAFDEDDPGNSLRFLGIPAEQVNKLFNDIVDKYIGKDDKEIKDKIALVCYIHMVWWNRVNEPNNQVRLKGCLGRLLPLLDKYDDVNIGD